MILTVLKAARVVVPIAVFMAMLSIGDALDIKFDDHDYSLTWHAYIGSVYWIGFPVFPIAAWLVTKSIYDAARAADSKEWPIAKGKIVASKVEYSISYVGILYCPKVRYRYKIAGNDYENDAVRSGRANFFTRGPAARIAARYPAGASVKVRCDPADPSESVLETNADSARRNIWIGLIALAFPFAAGAAVTWLNSL